MAAGNPWTVLVVTVLFLLVLAAVEVNCKGGFGGSGGGRSSGGRSSGRSSGGGDATGKKSSSEDDGLTGSVIGIIVGVPCGIILTLLLCYIGLRKCAAKERKKAKSKRNLFHPEKPMPYVENFIYDTKVLKERNVSNNKAKATPKLPAAPPPYQTIDPLRAQRIRTPLDQNWIILQPPTLMVHETKTLNKNSDLTNSDKE